MTQQKIVLSFLQLTDFGLLFVLGGAAVVTSIAVNIAPKYLKTPIIESVFKPRQRALTRNLLIGAAIFGVGWGLSGQCPGSALASLGVGNFSVVVGLIAMFIGAYLQGLIENPKR